MNPQEIAKGMAQALKDARAALHNHVYAFSPYVEGNDTPECNELRELMDQKRHLGTSPEAFAIRARIKHYTERRCKNP